MNEKTQLILALKLIPKKIKVLYESKVPDPIHPGKINPGVYHYRKAALMIGGRCRYIYSYCNDQFQQHPFLTLDVIYKGIESGNIEVL